jgi:phage shock protein C
MYRQRGKMMMKPFRLDKRNAMLLGVCSGIANSLGIDATVVRIGVIALTLFGGFPWTCIAYVAAAWFAKPLDGATAIDRASRSQNGMSGLREDTSDLDRRLADLERHASSTNSALAREIDELR